MLVIHLKLNEADSKPWGCLRCKPYRQILITLLRLKWLECSPDDLVSSIINAPDKIGIWMISQCGTIAESGDILPDSLWIGIVHLELKPVLFG